MKRDLSRLLRPTSIALFGGGWAINVAEQLKRSGFDGDIWPVHPTRSEICGLPCFASIDQLPGPPDAAFIGVNRQTSVDVVGALNAMGAGGATCFASGFRESEDTGGSNLQAALVEAAGAMPILGPNCYGFLNYLDNVTLWPDQHGGTTVEAGVGIIAQSSNIAINMTMQRRGLPIAYMIAAGNQAQTGIAQLGEAMLADERVTAIGLYLEGFGDIPSFEAFAAKAAEARKPIVVLKTGRSQKAQAAGLTHTASLAGGAAASSAFLKRMGMIEVSSIAVFLETLKLMHHGGPLTGDAICSVSCSGGEASLMADLAQAHAVEFRDFSPAAHRALKDELGPIVAIANPLDYHTFIWGDTPRMTGVFSRVLADGFDLTVFVLDLPRRDRCDPSGYQCAVDAIIAATQQTGARTAVLSSLPENLDESYSVKFEAHGVTVLHGMEEALAAIAAAANAPEWNNPAPVLAANTANASTHLRTLNEHEAKRALAAHGLMIPPAAVIRPSAAPDFEVITVIDAPDMDITRGFDVVTSTGKLSPPYALKALGVNHKSDVGAVRLNLRTRVDVLDALDALNAITDLTADFLLEEMAAAPVAELIVGVSRDDVLGLTLTIGAGGVLTELLDDTATLLLPARAADIEEAIASLRMARILDGYRGKPACDRAALVEAISAIAAYAVQHADTLEELDVNPLFALTEGAIGVDALIVERTDHD